VLLLWYTEVRLHARYSADEVVSDFVFIPGGTWTDALSKGGRDDTYSMIYTNPIHVLRRADDFYGESLVLFRNLSIFKNLLHESDKRDLRYRGVVRLLLVGSLSYTEILIDFLTFQRDRLGIYTGVLMKCTTCLKPRIWWPALL
jgi:hypothetical protein